MKKRFVFGVRRMSIALLKARGDMGCSQITDCASLLLCGTTDWLSALKHRRIVLAHTVSLVTELMRGVAAYRWIAA